MSETINAASRSGGDGSSAYLFEVGRNASRLAPGGTWIKGGTSKPDGNALFGAVTSELGISLQSALTFGDVDEIIHDMVGLMGIVPYDGNFGRDSEDAKQQISEGADCP